MDLILAICMITSPADCREERVSVSVEDMTPMQCMMISQQVVAQWASTHPKWKVEKWSCAKAGRFSYRI